MPISYYQNSIQGQGVGILTSVPAGINEYLPATKIDDSFMSSLLNVESWRDSAYLFGGDSVVTIISEAQTIEHGHLVSVLPSDEVVANSYVFYGLLGVSNNDSLYICKIVFNHVAKTLTMTHTAELTDPAGETTASFKVHSASFRTEADVFHCFVSEGSTRLHFMKHSTTADTYGYTALPAKPTQIVSHANRLFFIDNTNRLWWCRAGDLFSWYSLDYDDDAIFATTNMKGTAYTITNQPNVTRPVTITHTVTDTADTVGTLALVGTANDDSVQSETITPPAATGRVQSLRHYKTISSLTPSSWSQGGATPDTISMGWGPIGGFVQEDAGYCAIEQETKLLDMCVLNGAIYIFSRSNIYIFQGTSYESFSMRRIITNIGVDPTEGYFDWKKLITANNMAYFIYNGDVYEFDGDSSPRIISRPVISGGKYVNGMLGGIDVDTKYYSLSATSEYLLLYRISNDSELPINYKFLFDGQSWWRYYAIFGVEIGSSFTDDFLWNFFFPSFDAKEMYYGYSQTEDPGGTQSFVFSTTFFLCTTGIYSRVITKAFNSLPSDKGTLSDIILEIQGTLSKKGTIKVYCGTSAISTPSTLVHTSTEYAFTGDVEILTIPLLPSVVANTHHYMILIIFEPVTAGATMKLYNIERRLRVEGRSR